MKWVPLIYKEYDLSDYFLVSEDGQIYSLRSNKILKQHLNRKNGYYGICISIDGKKKLIKPHIAVAFNFIEGYKKNLIVNHKDGNKKNNKYTNLEWVTWSENSLHASKIGLKKECIKIKCINTGEIFNSISDACSWSGIAIGSRSMYEYLRGKKGRKSAGKHPKTKERLQWELI